MKQSLERKRDKALLKICRYLASEDLAYYTQGVKETSPHCIAIGMEHLAEGNIAEAAFFLGPSHLPSAWCCERFPDTAMTPEEWRFSRV